MCGGGWKVLVTNNYALGSPGECSRDKGRHRSQSRADVKEVVGLEPGSNGQELASVEQRTGVGQLGLEGLPCPSPLHFAQLGPPLLGLSLPHSVPLSPSCLEFLLDNGADPSLRDRQGYTAVHYAAAYGNRQNLELVCAGSGEG